MLEKAANVKLPKASLDVTNIMKVVGGVCGGVLVKDYPVYNRGINK